MEDLWEFIFSSIDHTQQLIIFLFLATGERGAKGEKGDTGIGQRGEIGPPGIPGVCKTPHETHHFEVTEVSAILDRCAGEHTHGIYNSCRKCPKGKKYISGIVSRRLCFLSLIDRYNDPSQ